MKAPEKPFMPPLVKVTVILLFSSLAFSVLMMLFVSLSPSQLPGWFAPVVGGISVVIMGFLTWAIASGRRWALNVYLILFILGIPASLEIATRMPDGQPASFMGLLAQTLAQVIALAILFGRVPTSWFAAHRSARKA
ncbi:MAG: hypothetical protein GTN81_14100 [Proteobacteria bacterium]|nr:hypothetical protein [Pseudomonadota bacterium]